MRCHSFYLTMVLSWPLSHNAGSSGRWWSNGSFWWFLPGWCHGSLSPDNGSFLCLAMVPSEGSYWVSVTMLVFLPGNSPFPTAATMLALQAQWWVFLPGNGSFQAAAIMLGLMIPSRLLPQCWVFYLAIGPSRLLPYCWVFYLAMVPERLLPQCCIFYLAVVPSRLLPQCCLQPGSGPSGLLPRVYYLAMVPSRLLPQCWVSR